MELDGGEMFQSQQMFTPVSSPLKSLSSTQDGGVKGGIRVFDLREVNSLGVSGTKSV